MDSAQGELVRQLDRLERLVNAAREVSGPSGVGSAQITVSAGGAGLWVAVTCCVAMLSGLLVATVFVAVAFADFNRQTQELRLKDETLQAYINSAYTVPQEETP